MKSSLKLVVAIMMVVLAACSTFAVDVSVSSGVADKYVAFGAGTVLSKDAVIQSDVFVSSTNSGFYADLWGSKSLGSVPEGTKNFGNELDYGIGYACTVKGFGVNVGVTYFDEPNIGGFGASDVWYSHAKVSHEIKPNDAVGPLTVFGLYENYKTMPNTGYEGGSLFSLGASAN